MKWNRGQCRTSLDEIEGMWKATILVNVPFGSHMPMATASGKTPSEAIEAARKELLRLLDEAIEVLGQYKPRIQ